MTKIREGNNKMFFFIGDNCFCQMPVSYTHLDVYKRQGQAYQRPAE